MRKQVNEAFLDNIVNEMSSKRDVFGAALSVENGDKGHWGMSGAFAFYNSDKDLYFTGTINQSSGFRHTEALKGMLKIIESY